jgi:hypothetical protein
MLGKILNIQFLLVKIMLPGDLTSTNILDSITVTPMEMLSSAFPNILSEEKLELIISSFPNKFKIGTVAMENFHPSILSL